MDHLFPYKDIHNQQYFDGDGGKCIHCGSGIPEPGYTNKLCSTCRTSFIRYPVPKWIWAFAGIILVMVIGGFVRSARFMGHARHLARAEKAIDARKYVTATKELDLVLAKFPDRVDANMLMVIASAYNHDIKRLQSAYEKVEGKEFSENNDLLRRAEDALGYAEQFFDVDTAFLTRCMSEKESLPGLKKLAAALDTSATITRKPMAYLYIANCLYDLKAFDLSETLIGKTLQEQPDNYVARMLLAAIWRETGRAPKAVVLLQEILQQNKEDVYALSVMSRTELKQFHDDKAAALARQALELAPDDCTALEARAMWAYCTGKQAESRQLLAAIRKTEIAADQDSTISARVAHYISGQESFR